MGKSKAGHYSSTMHPPIIVPSYSDGVVVLYKMYYYGCGCDVVIRFR